MKVLRRLRQLADPVVDVILPQACWAGGAGAVAMGLSEQTRREIAVLGSRGFCYYCGLSLGPYEVHDKKNPCRRCGTREVGVDRLARAGTFSEPLVRLVHQMKFGRAWELAPALAPFVYQGIVRVAEGQGAKVDVLVPVPLHWQRRGQRGFNQAEELAREVGRLGGWPVDNVLRRVRRTAEQAMTQSLTERRENLRGAFACRARAGRKVGGKHVWLVDDVSTTGATLHAAATALRKLGRGEKPASISAAVLCVTEGEDEENKEMRKEGSEEMRK